jgi:hypothetical protein
VRRARNQIPAVILTDRKEGGAKNGIKPKADDPVKKAEHAKLLAGKSVTFSLETAGDAKSADGRGATRVRRLPAWSGAG